MSSKHKSAMEIANKYTSSEELAGKLYTDIIEYTAREIKKAVNILNQ